MAISLQKGQKIDLTKTNPGLSKITVGLGWDVNKYDGGSEFDLDASAFLLRARRKMTPILFSTAIRSTPAAPLSPQGTTERAKARAMTSRYSLTSQKFPQVFRK